MILKAMRKQLVVFFPLKMKKKNRMKVVASPNERPVQNLVFPKSPILNFSLVNIIVTGNRNFFTREQSLDFLSDSLRYIRSALAFFWI